MQHGSLPRLTPQAYDPEAVTRRERIAFLLAHYSDVLASVRDRVRARRALAAGDSRVSQRRTMKKNSAITSARKMIATTQTPVTPPFCLSLTAVYVASAVA